MFNTAYIGLFDRSLLHMSLNQVELALKNATLNPDEKTTGATIGYNVRVANNNLRYNLRLP